MDTDYFGEGKQAVMINYRVDDLDALLADLAAAGVWIDPTGENPRKICAIGVRASRGRTMHGFALNVDPDLDLLTPRERQVLRLIARGYSYRDIATELSISAKTVESHVSSVLRKLQLSNRHQLSNWASQRHLN